MPSDDVLFERRGALGLITLNRPKALNALNQPMAVAIHEQITAWASDPAVRAVAIQGTGERAFCAGGDIRALHDWGKAGDPAALRFYRDEYRMNDAIKHYPKPYVALIEGIVMGGGVGLSVHGSHRVLAEKALLAMPETGIGFFPDVGGTYALPRCPGEIGLYLGLTGARLRRPDAIAFGIATHAADYSEFPAIVESLAAGGSPDSVLKQGSADGAVISPQRALIDRCFSGGSIEEIIARLDAEQGDFARETRDVLSTKSPRALKVTFRALREGKNRDFKDCMRMEYRLTHRFWNSPDYLEGVRSVIIDKDNQPKWLPPQLSEVSDAAVEAYFQPIDKELDFP